MVTVIAFADPSSRDEVLFHFIPLRAALFAFARVIGNISSKGREHFLPLLHFLIFLLPLLFLCRDMILRSGDELLIIVVIVGQTKQVIRPRRISISFSNTSVDNELSFSFVSVLGVSVAKFALILILHFHRSRLDVA